jgi:hypothetical protein
LEIAFMNPDPCGGKGKRGRESFLSPFACMVENHTHLLDSDGREPLHKLSNLDPIFEVLKEG